MTDKWTLEPWEYQLAKVLSHQVTLRTLAAATLMRGTFDDDQPGRYVSDQMTLVLTAEFSERITELAVNGVTERDCMSYETLTDAYARATRQCAAFAHGILAEARQLERDAQERGADGKDQ